jgi:peptidoglycan/LPS O-acetylase OafA/YrhL
LQDSIQFVAPGSDLQETAASSLAAAHLSGKPAVTRAPDRVSSASARTSRHIPSLDGIRAGSFLIVFGSHALSGSWGPFGVTVFFFLSGFLITTLMRAEYERNGSINLRHFWSRRALRILPPLYLVVLGSALLALAVYPPGTVHGAAMASQLLFYANYYQGQPEVPGTGVIWSLAVEEHFYLLFPLLYVAMQRWRLSGKHQAWLLWGLCVVVLVWRCVLAIAMHAPSGRIFTGTDTRIDSILFGCALAVWRNPVIDRPVLAPNLLKYLLLPVAVLVLLACAYADSTAFAGTWSFSFEGAALTVVFIAAIRLHDWPPFRILNWRPVVFMGVLSYSLYLVHDVLLQALARVWELRASLRAVVALTLSMTVAWTIYELVESPCARLRKRLTD